MSQPPDPSDFRRPGLRRADFLGAFAVVRRHGRILMVQNQRHIDGREQLTWDLPGGQVEPGELLHETLARELDEETGLEVRGTPTFLFVQEGQKRHRGQRHYAWRSFFFEVETSPTEPTPGSEILDLSWMDPGQMDEALRAPYHDSFRTWLARGGTHFHSVWDD